MLTDIHGVDPPHFKADLGEHSFRDSSRRKRRKHPPTIDRTSEPGPGEDGFELQRHASVDHVDIQA